MSEIPELPPRTPLSRPVPEGGLERAVTVGRRRRNRFVGAAGGLTTALVLVVAAGVLSPAPTNDSLRFADPTPAASPSMRPDRAEPSPQPEPLATGTPMQPGRAGTPPATPAPRTPRQAAQPGPAAEDAPTPQPASRTRPAYVEAPRDVEAPTQCVSPPNPTIGFSCGYVIGDIQRTYRQGDRIDLGYGECNPRGGVTDYVLEFDDGQEHQMTARVEDGPQVWRFSDTVRYPQGPHVRRLAQGRCLEYRNSWDTRSAAGRLVPPGRYVLGFRIAPDVFNGQRRETGSLEITVEIVAP